MPLIEEIASDSCGSSEENSEENDGQSSVTVPLRNAERLDVQSDVGVDLCFIPQHQGAETLEGSSFLDGGMHIFGTGSSSQHESHMPMIEEVESHQVADACNELLLCGKDACNNVSETDLPSMSYSVSADVALKSMTDGEDSAGNVLICKFCACS